MSFIALNIRSAGFSIKMIIGANSSSDVRDPTPPTTFRVNNRACLLAEAVRVNSFAVNPVKRVKMDSASRSQVAILIHASTFGVENASFARTDGASLRQIHRAILIRASTFGVDSASFARTDGASHLQIHRAILIRAPTFSVDRASFALRGDAFHLEIHLATAVSVFHARVAFIV